MVKHAHVFLRCGSWVRFGSWCAVADIRLLLVFAASFCEYVGELGVGERDGLGEGVQR